MGGAGVAPRNAVLDGTGATDAHNVIMDAWFALTVAGGGAVLDTNLTAAKARI
jgi:hypothetical protein